MTTLDWVIAGFVVLLAFYGYSRGFIVGALSLAGFVVGAYIGTRLGPLVLSKGDRSPYAPLFGLAGALLAGGILATGLEGVGLRARTVLALPLLRIVDGLLGALFTCAFALGLAWLVGAVVLQASGSKTLRTDIERSAIMRELNRVLPPSGPILNALARFDPLRRVSGPPANVAAAGARNRRQPWRARRDAERRARGRRGLRPRDRGKRLGGGSRIWSSPTRTSSPARTATRSCRSAAIRPTCRRRPVVFDPRNDIAVLRVDGLDEPSLQFAADPQGRDFARRSSGIRSTDRSTGAGSARARRS